MRSCLRDRARKAHTAMSASALHCCVTMRRERTLRMLHHRYPRRRGRIITHAECTEDVVIRNLCALRGGDSQATPLAQELHACGRGVVFDGDGCETEHLVWNISWRHDDAAFEEQLTSTDTSNRALGSAYAIGFTGTSSSSSLWEFENCSTHTLADGDERDELILVSLAQNGNILLEALRAFIMKSKAAEGHTCINLLKVEDVTACDDGGLTCTLRMAANDSTDTGGVIMLVELRENGARDPESDVALVLTLRPYHIRGNSAREFSWSERRVSFGCSKEEHALVVRRVEIDGADGRLLSRFIVDEHTSGPWRNPASLPLPESVFGIDRVLSNRRSRYTRPEAALVPDQTMRFVNTGTGCDAVLSVNGKVFVEPLFGVDGDKCDAGDAVRTLGEFIVDTGASCSLINITCIDDNSRHHLFESLSDKPVVLQGGFFPSAGAGSETSRYYRCTREMDFCGMKIKHQRFVSFDFARSPLSGLSSGWKSSQTEVAGLIGSDILSRAVVVMRAPSGASDGGGRWGEQRVECYDPRTYNDASAQGTTTHWVHVEMIGGIPHLLCRCHYRDAKQQARGAALPAKGFGARKASLTQDEEKYFVDVWLGMDSAFNNASVAKNLSVFITDEIAVRLAPSFLHRGVRDGNANADSSTPSISTSMAYVGMLDSVDVLSPDRTGEGNDAASAVPNPPVVVLGEAQLFVTKAAMAKAIRRGKRQSVGRDGDQNRQSLSSSGMLSSTLFARRTVVLDLARRRIKIGVVSSS